MFGDIYDHLTSKSKDKVVFGYGVALLSSRVTLKASESEC